MLDALREKDLLKDTMVIFTSDHGDLETAHRMIFKGPFMYLELVDIPLVVAFPDQGVQPRTSDALINNIDLLPTIAGYAGLNIELQMDGKSFKEVIDGEKNEHRQYVVSEYYCKQRWCNPCRMLATAEFKYVRYRDGYEELYNHFNDQLENHNLADRSDFQHIKQELSQKLDQWMRETGDTFEQMPVSDRAGRVISV
jgi:choline-sulfatase